jgi:hypothetical protein
VTWHETFMMAQEGTDMLCEAIVADGGCSIPQNTVELGVKERLQSKTQGQV